MKIEDVTAKGLKKLSAGDIVDLRTRCVRLFGFMKAGGCDVISGVTKRDLLAKYRAVREEMDCRGIALAKRAGIDEAVDPRILRKRFIGMDVEALPDRTVSEKFVSLSGSFVSDPKSAKVVDVVIRSTIEKRDLEMEKALAAAIEGESGRPARFAYLPDGPGDAHISIYDLILRPRGPMKAVIEKAASVRVGPTKENLLSQEIQRAGGWMVDHTEDVVIFDKWESKSQDSPSASKLYKQEYVYNKSTESVTLVGKPIEVRCVKTYEEVVSRAVIKQEALEKIETTENYHRIPVRGKVQGHEIRTIDVGSGKGIKALEDVDDKEIVTYMFDVDKWTLEEAKTWVSEHKKKSAWFRVYKADKAKHIVGGVIYEPDVEDTQGEYTDADEIEKAMYGFMEKYFDATKRIKVMHKGKAHDFPILECFQADEDTKKGKDTISKGAWYLTIKVMDEDIWKDIEAGILTGFSMGGMARSAK